MIDKSVNFLLFFCCVLFFLNQFSTTRTRGGSSKNKNIEMKNVQHTKGVMVQHTKGGMGGCLFLFYVCNKKADQIKDER